MIIIPPIIIMSKRNTGIKNNSEAEGNRDTVSHYIQVSRDCL